MVGDVLDERALPTPSCSAAGTLVPGAVHFARRCLVARPPKRREGCLAAALLSIGPSSASMTSGGGAIRERFNAPNEPSPDVTPALAGNLRQAPRTPGGYGLKER